jgi:Tfp pilus assembly protein PilF
MGNCAAKSGDLNEARAYYDEALRIKRKQLGNNNTSVAQTLHNIGNVLVAQGSNEGAMKNLQGGPHAPNRMRWVMKISR